MKAHFVKKARKNIYETGKSFKNKRGFTDIDRTKPATKKDKIVIKKGESYWWWKFRFWPKSVSKTEPILEQLRKYGISDWESNTTEYNTRKDELTSVEEQEELVSDIEEFKSELEDRLSNVPDSLQESSVLNERIEELDTLISEVNEWEFILDEDEDNEEEDD